jgi:hypothetical protein
LHVDRSYGKLTANYPLALGDAMMAIIFTIRKWRILQRLTVITVLLLSCIATSGRAALITFSNGDSLDGDVAGSTAIFLLDAQNATLTTRSVGPSGAINTTTGQLGINAVGSDTANAFNNGETWSFDWSINTLFQGIDFRSFSTATESFRLQADDWIGLTISPQDSDIAFNSGAGRFTFTSGDTTDNFNLTDLSNGAPLAVAAGSDVTLVFSDTGSGSAGLQSLTFASNAASVPEPKSLFLAGFLALAFLGYGRFLKDCQTVGSHVEDRDLRKLADYPG